MAGITLSIIMSFLLFICSGCQAGLPNEQAATLDNRISSQETAKTGTQLLYPVLGTNGKWGYIDTEGTVIIDYIYDKADFFKEGLAAVSSDGKWGFINPDGIFIIKPQYDFCSGFKEGLSKVVITEGNTRKTGFINKEGETFFRSFLNGNAGNFSEGLAVFEKDGLYGYIDTNGNICINPQYTYAGEFSEGLAVVVDENCMYGYIDRNGQVKIQAQYPFNGIEYLQYLDFHDGLSLVEIEGKSGFINTDGDIAIEAVFDNARNFSEGLAQVQTGGKWGYINTNGEWVINPEYKHCTKFQEAYAFVKPFDDEEAKGSSQGLTEDFMIIDANGNVVSNTTVSYPYGGGYTFPMEWHTGFVGELARVIVDEVGFAYINKSGDIIWLME